MAVATPIQAEQTHGVTTSTDPHFSFGLIADVQYADDDNRPGIDRHYRASLPKLEEAINEFNRHDLAFVVHLGDLVDHDLRLDSTVCQALFEISLNF